METLTVPYFYRVSVKGFSFIVNSYWPEVEQRIEDYLPIIFAPGNPELFHKVNSTVLKLTCFFLKMKLPAVNLSSVKQLCSISSDTPKPWISF